MARELTLILRVRSMLASGLKAAQNEISRFAGGLKTAFLSVGKWVLGAGAAVGAVAAKALSAYAEQEKAVRSLESALSAYGEEVTRNSAALQAQASAIQDETATADELTIARMARLKLLGMETTLLGPAAKGVIALAEAGMEETAAMKALVAAREGDYSQLTRYLPQLKTATSEAEKAAIVNDFLTRGYQASKDRLNTVAGSWAALKGRIGDAWEEIGKAISQNGALTAMLQTAGDKVKELGARIAEWVAGGGIGRLIESLKVFAEESRTRFTIMGLYGVQAFRYVGNVIGTWLNATVESFRLVGKFATAMWETIKNPLGGFNPPDMSGYLSAMRDMWGAIKGEGAGVRSEIEAEEQRHAAALAGIAAQTAAAQAAEATKRADAEVAAIERIDIAAENHAKQIEELTAKRKELEEQIAEAEGARIDKVREEALQGEIDALDKVIAKREELAKMTVAEFIEKQRGDKADAESRKAESDRLDKLQAKKDRGVKLSKRDAEQLAARGAMAAEAAQLKIDQKARADAERDLKALRDKDSANIAAMKGSLANIENQLAPLLIAKGD